MSDTSTTPAKRPVDWERVEFDYRAGIKTLRQIADEHGITHGAVNKRAKAKGWTRDLSAKIQAKAAEKVSKALVSTEVSRQREITEQQIVEVNATAVASVIQRHRAAIGRHQSLVDKMLAELEALVDNQELFEQLGDLMDKSSDEDDDGGKARADRQNELYRRIIAMPGRVDSAKKLVETLEKLVKMERESFGLNDAAKSDDDPMAGGRTITDAERAVRLLHFLRAGGVSE